MQTESESIQRAFRAEADRLVETLRTTRLTVLTGVPGSGKTRLLCEGVLPRLRRRSDDSAVAGQSSGASAPAGRRRGTVRPRELVVWCDRWDGSPAEQVHSCLDALTGAPSPTPGMTRPPLALRAKAISAERGARLLFAFDHADRIAGAPDASPGPAAEYDALVNALCSVSPSVHLLLSARDGALPPSVQSRLGSPDTRTLRLPDPADEEAVPGVDGAAPEGPPVDAGRPLRRDDVYASIAERLGTIAARPDAPAWGTAPGDRTGLADRAAAAPMPPAHPGPATAGFGRDPFLADTPTGGPSGAMAGEPRTTGTADPTPLPPFVSGSFADASSRRSRGVRRTRGAAVALGLVALVGVGIALWQERADPGLWPQPSDRRVAAAVARDHRPASVDEASLAAVDPRQTASAPALADDRVAALPSPAAPMSQAPASEAKTASIPPAASEDVPSRPATTEQTAEALLADDLWREMSRHGLARLAVRAADDPVDALVTGRRLAVVPYDALRALAAAHGTARTARIVAPLFTEEMHVIVRADSPLAFIHQIAGRRIDVGPVQSARRQTAVAFLQRLFGRPLSADETHSADLAPALADLFGGAVDAIVLPEPQPSAWLSKLPVAQRARLRLLGAAPGDASTRRALRSYLPATLPAPAATSGPAVKTFAVMTFLVANPVTRVGSDDTATVAAKALCGSLPTLRRDGHPKWREVDATLQLPVPLPYDAGAAAVMRACDAARRPAAVPGVGNEFSQRGDRE